MKKECLNRRGFLKNSFSAFASTALVRNSFKFNSFLAPPVGIASCKRYEFNSIKDKLSELFNAIGGVRTLIQGKTVTVKLNLTGNWKDPIYTLTPEETIYTHPLVTLAAISLFQDYGARRIILAESFSMTEAPRSNFQWCGYDVHLFESMVPIVEWEDTRNQGSGKGYKSLPVMDGGVFYDEFHLNHAYTDTDVMVSIAKMKNHDIAGITLSLKNLFGITPTSIYSEHNLSEDPEDATSARIRVLHTGELRPTADGEILPIISEDPGVRVPNIIVDIVKARPIDLSIIDGIVSTHGGEGAWLGGQLGLTVPSLLIAGMNPVCTDAVGAAIMGYDPEAKSGEKPFFPGVNHLQAAADRGIGTNRLQEIDIVGLKIKDVQYSFLPGYDPKEE